MTLIFWRSCEKEYEKSDSSRDLKSNKQLFQNCNKQR